VVTRMMMMIVTQVERSRNNNNDDTGKEDVGRVRRETVRASSR